MMHMYNDYAKYQIIFRQSSKLTITCRVGLNFLIGTLNSLIGTPTFSLVCYVGTSDPMSLYLVTRDDVMSLLMRKARFLLRSQVSFDNYNTNDVIINCSVSHSSLKYIPKPRICENRVLWNTNVSLEIMLHIAFVDISKALN